MQQGYYGACPVTLQNIHRGAVFTLVTMVLRAAELHSGNINVIIYVVEIGLKG